MIPLLTFIYGPAEAIAVGIGLATLGYVLLLPEAMRDADWPDVIPASLMGFVFVPIGIFLLFVVDPGVTRRLMGAIVILVALVMLRGWNYDGPRNMLTSAAAGSFTGFTTGLFGMGAPGVSIYYLSGRIGAAYSARQYPDRPRSHGGPHHGWGHARRRWRIGAHSFSAFC